VPALTSEQAGQHLSGGVDVQSSDEQGLQFLLQTRRSLAWTGLPALVLLPPEDLQLRQTVEERLPSRSLSKPVATEVLIAHLQGLLH
jgi:hypothetical protein